MQIVVFGSKGDTGLQVLDDSRNNFERGATDRFFFKAPDIGDITSCKVRCWADEAVAMTVPYVGVDMCSL